MRNVFRYIADKQGAILSALLVLIAILFLGIMAMTYIVSKRANPIMLDEHGKPIQEQPATRR